MADLDITVRGVTDSQCNAYTMIRHYSRKLPLATVHMVFMFTAAQFGIWLRISHVKRAYNTWADDLTADNVSGVNPQNRWNPELHEYLFNVLDRRLGAPRSAS